MSIRAVKQAVLDRLAADPGLAGSVYESLVTDRPERYVSVFANSGVRCSSRFTGASIQSTQTFTIHSVGSEPDQAQWVADHVFAQLLDWTPTVAGYSFRRFVHASSQPMQRDDDVAPAVLFYCVDDFDVTFESIN